MLAHARTLGHIFDPLTVFWCLRPAAARAAVLEVHNTYGERHAYLLEMDDAGDARSTKRSTCRPSTTSSGTYAVRLRPDARRSSGDIVLPRRPDAC